MPDVERTAAGTCNERELHDSIGQTLGEADHKLRHPFLHLSIGPRVQGPYRSVHTSLDRPHIGEYLTFLKHQNLHHKAPT